MLRVCLKAHITFTFFSFDVVVSRSFLADRLVTDITIEQFLPQCPTLCDPIDGSPPGFPVPGILQATLECPIVVSGSAESAERDVCVHSQPCLTLCNPMDCQAALSMGFSRQE